MNKKYDEWVTFENGEWVVYTQVGVVVWKSFYKEKKYAKRFHPDAKWDNRITS